MTYTGRPHRCTKSLWVEAPQFATPYDPNDNGLDLSARRWAWS